jgi:hypothetical protein
MPTAFSAPILSTTAKRFVVEDDDAKSADLAETGIAPFVGGSPACAFTGENNTNI